MQDALRQTNASSYEHDDPQDLKGIDSPSGCIRIGLATDRVQIASRLTRLLGNSGEIEILPDGVGGPAGHGVQTGQRPAVLVLDCGALASQERSRLQRAARSHFPARVLWLLESAPTGNHAARSVLDAVKAGWCHGYVTVDCQFETLVRAIAAVAQHDFWLPRAMLAQAFSESQSLRAVLGPPIAPVQEGNRARTVLTTRERQILALVRRGLTNKEVGRQLGIEEDTVKKHLQNMYAKLGVHRRAQMLFRSAGEARASG